MRKILFKAKRVDNGEWVESKILWQMKEDKKFENSKWIQVIKRASLWDDTEDRLVRIKTNTLCQFTGLLDKNVNKIFEGDTAYDGTTETTGIIKYKEIYAQFVFEYDDNKKHETLYPAFVRNLEIIGNIHDREK